MNNSETKYFHKYILLSAFIAGISFPGNQLGLLSFIAYIPFFYVVHHFNEVSKKRSFLYGALFGLYYSIFSMYWVGLSTFGGFIGMTLTIAIRFGLMTLLFKILIKKKSHIALLIPFLIIQEYLSAYSDLDYTWHLSGYSLTDFPLLCQIAEYTGVYGLSFIIYSINMLLFLAFLNKDKAQILLKYTSVLIILFIGINSILFHSQKSEKKLAIKVGVLQPNIDPFVKWQSKYKKIAVNRLLKQTENTINDGADHIVYPETSIPYVLRSRFSRTIRQKLSQISSNNNVSLVVGALDKKNDAYYNSVFHFFPNRPSETYDKQKLVPVAEKVIYPAVMAIFGDLLPGMSGWGKGEGSSIFESEHQTYMFNEENQTYEPYKTKSLTFASTICIESTFPEFMSEFKEKGARWINIITNDGWFYPHWDWFKSFAESKNFSPFFPSKGAYQHNKIAILRAIENRVSVIRSANTGISAIIDPMGNIVKSTEQYTEGYITGYLPLSDGKQTFFNQFGVWIVWLNCFFLVLFISKQIVETFKTV